MSLANVLRWALYLTLLVLAGCANQPQPTFDTIISGGLVYDGTGSEPKALDIGIVDDRIVAMGQLDHNHATTVVEADGQAVAPGFINMLSWATDTLLHDGRGLSDIHQGVTLEVMGEGWSMGPWNSSMKEQDLAQQGDIRYDIEWTSLGEYLEHLERRGVSPNIASFVGATTVRIHELGEQDRAPTPDELERMRKLVRTAMEEGAMGVGSSLIYAPAFYASTEELIALVDVAEDLGGSYISHIRSEGNQLLQAMDEVLDIAKATGAAVEIYHLKAAGKENWPKMDRAIAKIESARAAGIDMRANMYTYPAGATGLDAAMPPWVQEGGLDAWVQRLKDPAIRARLRQEIETPTDDWENLYLAAGDPSKLLLIGFRSDALKPLTGKTLAEVAAQRGTSAADTMMDLVIEDNSRVGTVYFLMSEENVAKQVALPWMSFGSDGGAMAPQGVFLRSSTHPRAYGNFVRVLGKYARDEGVISLTEAVRKLTSLPAKHLKIRQRGELKVGNFADIVVFDPETVTDRATFVEPHRLATGVTHVWVNGERVLEDGEHTGATPGRVVRGPGWVGWQ
ncbi:MAG: amidohydrolase family protein [Lysobacterales bacterium]